MGKKQENNYVGMPLEEYKQLIWNEARAQALMGYINNEEYSISGKICSAILGCGPDEVEDEKD